MSDWSNKFRAFSYNNPTKSQKKANFAPVFLQ